jgi:tetratricopeptide (TPR) repeat protein
MALWLINCIAKAAEIFEAAIQLDSLNLYCHSDLGTLLGVWSQLDEALNAYQKALKIKPGYPLAFR